MKIEGPIVALVVFVCRCGSEEAGAGEGAGDDAVTGRGGMEDSGWWTCGSSLFFQTMNFSFFFDKHWE